MRVLSCFDGMACGKVALERSGIPVTSYHAFEIDKYAIQVATKNHPDIIEMGDITQWEHHKDIIPIPDLIIAGSPCQGFSNAGKGLNFDDPRSKLFFVFVDILNYYKSKNPNLKFMLENVRMKQEWQDVISSYMEVEPVKLNSSLVSAQNRVRLYWANFPITAPEDRRIVLSDIIEDGNVDRDKSYTIDANYHKGGNPRSNFEDGKRQLVFGADIRNQVTKHGTEEQLNIRKDEKSNCVVPSYPHKLNGVIVKTIPHGYIPEKEEVKDKYPSLCAQDPSSKHLIQVGMADDVKGLDINRRVYSSGGKSPPLSTMQGGHRQPKIAIDFSHYRKLTPVECERLQTLPDNYTAGVSNTQRYKMIGNGWTIDMVSHILNHLPSH